MSASKLEETLYYQIKVCGLPEPVRELMFAPPRRWRFDFSWIDKKLAVEVEGGAWTGGRHTRGAGFEADMEKYNMAVLLGWRVLRFAPIHLKTGVAIQQIEEALK